MMYSIYVIGSVIVHFGNHCNEPNLYLIMNGFDNLCVIKSHSP